MSVLKKLKEWLFRDCYRLDCRCCGATLKEPGGCGIALIGPGFCPECVVKILK